jgi:hypothetical protein
VGSEQRVLQVHNGERRIHDHPSLVQDAELLGLPFEVTAENGHVYKIGLLDTRLSSLEFIVQKVKELGLLHEYHPYGGVQWFTNLLLARTSIPLAVDSHGLIFFTELTPGESANAHYVFWDKKTQFRHAIMFQTGKWVFDTFKLERLNIALPVYAFAALNRMHKMGIRLEGIRRQAMPGPKKRADVLTFGVLRSELTPEAIARGKLERTAEENAWFGLLRKQPELMRRILTEGVEWPI